MATLDEVISQMSEEDYFSDSIQFIIDSDLRIVSIPDRGVVAGVVGDKNVNRINFQMPRYYNGFDMSKFTTKVNYINANSNMNYYAVTDLIVENDTILFTWLIDSDAVAYAGTVMFSVNMFIADSNGKITQAFNTSNKGKMTVLEGIQVDEYVTPEAQEDILTRLEADLTKCVNSGINQINTVTNESIQKIQVESTKATDSISAGLSKIATRTDESVKKVQDEGEKVKASIPTDYTELTETVSDLETQSSNLDYEVNSRLKQFYKYSKGATKINDSDNGRLHNLKVYGRSEQKQYSGKNLLNATLQTTTVNGVTCTNNGDGTYTLDGTANANAVFNLGSVTFTGDTKYKICGCPQGGGIIERYHIEPYGSTNEQRDIGNGVIYSLSNDETKAIYIVVTIGFRVNNLLFKPMITTDLTATYDDFEPYTGGIPSPNPDYPQEIKSVVNPTVKVCGKNLLEDGSLKSDNNGKIEYISAGKIKVTSSISAWYAAITNTLKLTPNTNYVLSAKCDSSNGNITCNSVSITGAYIKCAFLTDSDGLATIAIRCRYESAESRFVYSDLQLEKGSTATAYEPYTEQTVALPYTLNAIPVSSGGNVTIDGQQYIADYVDVERGKLVRMCKEYVITGSERLAMYWLGNASYLRNVCCINNFENIVLYDGINPLAMSDMFIGKISENADDERAIYLMLRGSGDKTLAIKFLDSDGITTVDLAKQWLIEHKPKTVFVLSTPEETDLTPEENEAFKALATYYPTTNIFANSEQLDGYTVFNYPTPFEDEWIKTKKDVDSLKEDINDLEETLFNNKSASIIPFHDNWILSDNGVLTENGCSVSDLIPVGNAKRLKLNFSLLSTVKSGRTIQFSTSSTNWQGIISTVTTTEKDKFVEIPTGAVYVRVAFPTNFSNPIISLFENSLKPEVNVGTDGIEDGAVTFAKQSFITKEYGENIYNESMMVDAVKSWYWFSGDRIIIQDADDYARITIPIDSTNKYITLSADNINSTYVQIYAWFFVGEDDETIITKDTDTHASFYNGNAITIPIPNNAKSLKLSIRQYSQIIGYDVIMANYGSSKKPYEKYSEELNIDGKKMLVEGSNAIRTSVYINASDTDTKFLLKMLEAYNKGNVDVFVEKGTYVLSNAYDYIRNTLGKTWTCGVPIGNDCRYYFNDSVIISNPPPDNFSDNRNVLDCFAKSNNYEIYDVTLINNGGRYCVHDEGNADAKPYFHKYVNVRMIYNATELSPTDGGSKPFGCGTGFDSSISFDGCEFIKDGGNADIFAIHGVVNNPNNHTVKLRVNMKNCYFNKSGIGINLFDVSRDDVEFMLFGNLWGLNFANDNVRIIANNNNLIN